MKLKSPSNKWFLAFVIAAVVAVTAIVVAIVAGVTPEKSEDVVYVEGPEIGVYYYDVVDGEVVLTLSGGNKFTIAGPKINKTGTYTVDGTTITLDFFKDEDGTTTATMSGDKIALVYDNATMQFTRKISYTVNFNVDGGSEIAPVTVVNGKTVGKPADPTKENAVFLGWYVDAAFTTAYGFGVSTVTADTTIYARWAEKQPGVPEYTVEFDLGYEGAEAPTAMTTIGGLAYDVPTPEREGYTFGGWWISMYEDGEKLSYAYTSEMQLTADTTLYAVWHDNSSSKLNAPAVTVTDSTISWDAVKGAASYKLTVVDPDGKVVIDNETVGATTKAFDFTVAKPGEYKITVVAVAGNEANNSEAAQRYYANKALDRVSSFTVENGILIFGAVENAQKYTVTIDCGNDSHTHTAFDNGTSTNFYIANCPMQEGGILVTVTASANGYASSTSKVFVYNKVLDKIGEVVYDAENDKFVWGAVAGTASYQVTVTVDGQEYTFNNGTSTSFSIAGYTGEIAVSVVPVTEGYNSPEATEGSCKKTAPAAPNGLTAAGMVISWNPVAGATAYEVNVGGRTVTVDTNRLDLSEGTLTLTQGQVYEVKVRAINANNESSSYSETMKTGYFVMNAALNYSQNTVSWTPVLGVNNYQVRVNGGNVMTFTDVTSTKVTLTKEGENLIEVRYVHGDAVSEWVSISVTAYAVEYDTRSVAYGSFYIEYLAVGDLMTLPGTGFEYAGYDFSGWYNAPKGAAGNGKKYGDGAVFNGNAYTVVYAEWSPKEYNVTLKTDGFNITNIENNAKETVTFSKDFTLTVPEAVDSGMYFFAGWYTGPSGTGVQVTDDEGKSVGPYDFTRDMILFPYYSTNALTFTLQSDDTYAVSKGPSIKNVSNLVIPVTYNEIPITKILESAFDGSDCYGIKSVSIPDTITLVGTSAFTSCKGLESIEVYKAKEGNYETIYSSVDGVLIREDMGTTYLEFVPRAKKGHFTIPAEVEKILTKAFYYTEIESLTIPATLIGLPKYAIYYCKQLKTVEFEYGRTEPLEFVYNSFYQCPAVETISLAANLNFVPDSQYIDFFDFLDRFTGLQSITIEEGHAEYSVVGGVLTDKTESTYLYCPRGYAGEVVIPNGISAIGDSAFYNRDLITSITIPVWVTSIGKEAFRSCDAVTSVIFEGSRGEDLTIADKAFLSMAKLETITFEGNGTTELDTGKVIMGTLAFAAAERENPAGSLHTVEVGAGVNIEKLNQKAFYYHARLTTFNVDKHAYIGAIDEYAFTGCARLTAFAVPGSVTSIGKYAFDGCINLADVTFMAEGAAELIIAEYAFRNCGRLTSFIMPDHMTDFNSSAFEGCEGLRKITVNSTNTNFINDENGVLYRRGSDGESLAVLLFYPKVLVKEQNGVINNLPATLTMIGGSAFSNNQFLKSITIPATVTKIDFSAFANCEGLETVTFAAGGTTLTIGDSAFEGCTDLTNIDLPAYTTTIGVSAFAGSGLKSFTVPQKVTSIANAAFLNCADLETITFNCDGELTIGDGAGTAKNGVFFGCNALKAVHLPAGTVSIGKYAFYMCAALETVSFEENAQLTTIYDYAFNQCASLKSIFIPKTVTSIGKYVLEMKNASNAGSLEEVIFEMGGTEPLDIGTTFLEFQPNIKSITLPARVRNIGGTAGAPAADYTKQYNDGKNFAPSCENLAEINIAVEEGITPVFSSVDGVLYNADQTVLLYCPPANVGRYDENGEPTYELIIPNTVQTVMTYACMNCTQLKTVTFEEFDEEDENYGEQLLSIGNYKGSKSYHTTSAYVHATFGGNVSSITTINLPSHLGKISASAFGTKSENILTININPAANNITLVDYAFSMARIAELKIPGTLKAIATYTFNACPYLTKVEMTLPTNQKKIPDYTFYQCKKLTSYEIPAQITEICQYAFRECESFTEVIIPEGVTKIGNYAFYGLTVESVTIPASVTTLGTHMFYNCKQLKTVVFAEGSKVTMIPKNIFYNCEALESINLQDLKLKEIQDYAFSGCVKLNDAVVDFTKFTSLAKLGGSAFQKTALEHVDLSQTKITTLNNSFASAAALKSIVLGSSITSVASTAFSSIPALESITLPPTATGDLLVALRGKSVELIIPEGSPYLVKDEYGVIYDPGYTVVYYAGGEKNDLTGYTIPETVMTIGSYAFAYTKMGDVVIPNGVTLIDGSAFYYTEITSVSIPATVTKIGANAFAYSSLQRIEFVDEHNSELTSVGGSAFRNTDLEVVVLPDNLDFPAGTSTTTIFASCSKLRSITFGAATTHISANMFMDCFALEEIHFQEGLLAIPYLLNASWGVTEGETNQVKTLHIPSTVVALEDGAFACFANLETVTFAEGSKLESIAWYAFWGCKSLKTVNLPDTVTSIGERAFYNCESLESLDMSNMAITMFDQYTFYNTKSLATLKLPRELETIGNFAFYNTGVVDLVIPGMVTSLGYCSFEGASSMKTLTFAEDSAIEEVGSLVTWSEPGLDDTMSSTFKGSTSLETVVLPNTVRVIGNHVFENSGVKSVTFLNPDEPIVLEQIGEYAFADCPNLTNFEYMKTVVGIGDYAFHRCYNLTSAPLYEGLVSLGGMAFAFCDQLPAAVIPASVRTLGGNPFAGIDVSKISVADGNENFVLKTDANGVVSLYDAAEFTLYGVYGLQGEFAIPESVKHIYPGLFAGTDVTSVIVPAQIDQVYDYMFAHCEKLTSVTIEGDITYIGDYAFYETAISSITIPNTVTEIGDYAFTYCANLNNVSIPAETLTLGNYCFAYCTALSNFEFVENTTSAYQILGTHFFYNCPNITEVILPTNFKNVWEDQMAHVGYNSTHFAGAIPSYMFAGTGIVEAVLPEQVNFWYTTGVFANCKSLEKIIMMDQATNDTDIGVLARFNTSWVEGCDNFQYFYTEYFTHNYAYVIRLMDVGGFRELHMGTVFDTSEDADVTAFNQFARFNYASEDFCLYFDKASYEEMVPYFENLRYSWVMKIYDKNGNLLVCDEEDGSVAYVLDQNGNKIWEATKE